MIDDQKLLSVAGWHSRSRDIGFVLGIGAAALLLGAVIGESWWLYLVAMIFAALIVLWPVQFTLGLFTFLVPFESLTRLGEGDSNRTVLSLLGAAAIGVLFLAGLVQKRLQRPPQVLWWWGGYLLWAGLTFLWAVDPQATSRRLITVGALWLLYLAASSFRLSRREFDWLVWLTILGGCAASAFSLYQYHAGASWYGSARATVVVGENEMNPNFFAIKLLLPLALALGQLFSRRDLRERIALVAAIGLNSVAVLFTMSRGALLAVLVIFAVFLIRMRSSRQLILAVSLLAVLGLALPGGFFQRWSEAVSTGGAGRTAIWAAGARVGLHYFWFGAGFGGFYAAFAAFAGYASQFYGYNVDPHNTYLQIWVDTGLVGLLLFARIVWLQLTFSKSGKRTDSPILIACQAAAYGLFVVAFFDSLLAEKGFWLVLVFLVFAFQAANNLESADLVPSVTRDPLPAHAYAHRSY